MSGTRKMAGLVIVPFIIDPNTKIEMGAFTQDFEYIEGFGDLDECNGREGVTPEFPEGIYYYVVTDDFPFFSRCLKGDF